MLALRANLVQAFSAGASAAVAACVADHLLLVGPGAARTMELATASDPTEDELAEIQGQTLEAFGACDP